MIREAATLATVLAILAVAASELPVVPFLVVVGFLPGLWWSSAAWDADDVDLLVALEVSVLAALPIVLLSEIVTACGVALACWVGAACARVRVRPASARSIGAEEWARRNAWRYRPGKADRPFPDTTSSDPYALLLGVRPLPQPPAPLEVPPEHEQHVGGSSP